MSRGKLHKWLTLAWLALIIPSVLWWKDSIPWLVFMSIWANVAGHWDASETANLEEKIEELFRRNS